MVSPHSHDTLHIPIIIMFITFECFTSILSVNLQAGTLKRFWNLCWIVFCFTGHTTCLPFIMYPPYKTKNCIYYICTHIFGICWNKPFVVSRLQFKYICLKSCIILYDRLKYEIMFDVYVNKFMLNTFQLRNHSLQLKQSCAMLIRPTSCNL